MNKVQRICFLVILIAFVSMPILLRGEAIPMGKEVVLKAYNTPFSSPQNSGLPNRPLEEDAEEDDDDQDKKFDHTPSFYIDSGSSALSQFHLLFRQQHHEIVTPPPQS